MIITAFFGATIFGVVYALRHVIFNRIPAAILIIGFCVITTSGYTFCQIRGTPMKGRSGKIKKKIFFKNLFFWEILGEIFANGGRMMYQAEAYILMFAEVGCALGLIIMNGKGALKNTVGLAIAFVCYVILLGTV